VQESLQGRRLRLRFRLAYFGGAIAARLHPDQIEDELHFGHPTSAVLVTTGISGRLFQDVFVNSGKRFCPKKTRRRYRNTRPGGA
jgi:hypothetical protein